MEIERKFLVKTLPDGLEDYPHQAIAQVYLSADPVIRARQRGGEYLLTVKGRGTLQREELELPLTREQFKSLGKKAQGQTIRKIRYCIPYGALTIELDVFDLPFAPLVLAEVEFESLAAAERFAPPEWFGAEVTEEPRYTNAAMSTRKAEIPPVKPGKYRHFKGGEYEVLSMARHSETEEPMVVYRALYGGGGVWVRPAAMWNETVEHEGKTVLRFSPVEE